MFELDTFLIQGKAFQGIKAILPDIPPLLLIKGDKGFIMCGYLNLEVAEKVNAIAAVVSNVNTFEDVLNAKIKTATSKAIELGLKPGKTVKDVIIKLNH
jgi:uncharacterized protein YunC (DUF1805 family)